MGLMTLAEIAPLLACPRCRAPVVDAGTALHCGSSACALSAAGSFPLANRRPLLVDFERSVLEPAGSAGCGALDPLRARWSIERLPPPLRPLFKPRNRIAAHNVDRMLTLLAAPS